MKEYMNDKDKDQKRKPASSDLLFHLAEDIGMHRVDTVSLVLKEQDHVTSDYGRAIIRPGLMLNSNWFKSSEL